MLCWEELGFWKRGISSVRVGVVVRRLMLFNFFFLRLTKVDKWVVGIWDALELWDLALNQAKSKQTFADTRWDGLTHKMRRMRSFASEDTLEKCSSGKLKSPLSMLLLVSSLESSRNGDRPLEKEWNELVLCGMVI